MNTDPNTNVATVCGRRDARKGEWEDLIAQVKRIEFQMLQSQVRGHSQEEKRQKEKPACHRLRNGWLGANKILHTMRSQAAAITDVLI